jgi:glyceraldehyde 3-phosphate dehydrogenase
VAAVRVGINGFGRIGRIAFRVMAARPQEFDVVSINDLGSPEALAMLLKYDSVHGRFDGTVEATERGLVVNGKKIHIHAEKDPRNLPWKAESVEVVVESTGFLRVEKRMANRGTTAIWQPGRVRSFCRLRPKTAPTSPAFSGSMTTS